MTEPALHLDRVSFRYGRTPVLTEVSLEVGPQETVCLVGPNGGGKTTLLRLMLGLLKPEQGTIRVFGSSPARQRRRLGYMPQQVRLDRRFPIRVREVVAMGRLYGNWPRLSNRQDRRVVDAVLEEMELSSLAGESFANLSGGQQQRVLIARALATEPDILFLDEPTAMIDPHIESRLLERLKERHRQMTLVLVSHDIAFVQKLVERVICVNRQVTTHDVTAVHEGLIHTLYGEPVRAVHHGHEHPPSSSHD